MQMLGVSCTSLGVGAELEIDGWGQDPGVFFLVDGTRSQIFEDQREVTFGFDLATRRNSETDE